MRGGGESGSADRFGENSCDRTKSMDRQGSEEEMENKVVAEKKIKVGMCRWFAKRTRAFQVLYYTVTGFQQRPRSLQLQSGL